MDKADLFKPRLPEEPFEIPGVGAVRIRGLNRMEALIVGQLDELAARERRMIRFGVVEPKLSDAEVKRWQQASPGGELEALTVRISQLSGLAPDADREAYRNFRGGSGEGVRALPSGEAEPDSGSATPEHEQ